MLGVSVICDIGWDKSELQNMKNQNLKFPGAGTTFPSAGATFQSDETTFQSAGTTFQSAETTFQSTGTTFQSAGTLLQCSSVTSLNEPTLLRPLPGDVMHQADVGERDCDSERCFRRVPAAKWHIGVSSATASRRWSDDEDGQQSKGNHDHR